MMDNSTVTEQPFFLERSMASAPLRKLLHRLMENWSARPDYYGEMLRQHPEIDPETLMKIR